MARGSGPIHLTVEQAVGLDQARARRLAEINEVLTRLGLKPFKRLGRRENGEWEILRYVGDSGNQWYRVVTFEVLDSDGELRTYNMIFNATSSKADGAAVIPVIGGQIATVRQHRVTLIDGQQGGWTTEFPRAFARGEDVLYFIPRGGAKVEELEPPADAEGLRNLPLSIIGAELKPLVASRQVALTRLIYLDDTFEDTGKNRVVLPIFVAVFMADTDILTRIHGTRQMRIRCFRWEDLLRDRRDLNMRDQASLSAITLFREYMDRNPGSIELL